MSANARLRGTVFEVLVTHFASLAGYSVCAPATKDDQLYAWAGMPMVHGLGEGHNADVLMVPPMVLPMTPESRLLIECKGYAKKVSLDVIRGAITVRNDLNSYKPLSNEEITRRIDGRLRQTARPRDVTRTITSPSRVCMASRAQRRPSRRPIT